MGQAVVLFECCSKVAQRSFTGCQRLHKGCAKVAQSLLKVVQRLQIAARAFSSSCRGNLKTCGKLLCCSNVAQRLLKGRSQAIKGCTKIAQRLCKGCAKVV